MELKDKILEAMDEQDPNAIEGCLVLSPTEKIKAAESIVKICDEEMIRLLEFVANRCHRFGEDANGCYFDNDQADHSAPTELLQLFKQNQ